MGSAPVYFYYRNGCHLCEELAAMLFRSWPDVAEKAHWRDVDTSAEWRRLYGLRVPVLIQGNALICELTPDPDALARYFGTAQKSV